MKSFILVDRDGTILREPADEQIDSLEKFHFVPGAISGLKVLRKLPSRLILASNQDGLGTPAFPREDFLPCHNLMIETLAGEGVTFDDERIDTSFPEEGLPTRKPGTGLFKDLMDGSWDLGRSYVIGDRESDVVFARNLGCKAILLRTDERFSPSENGPAADLVTDSWAVAAEHIRRGFRRAVKERVTRETSIRVTVDLDGRGPSGISTGLNFFDHMLEQIPYHSGISLQISAQGDLQVDEHHTMEDTAILFGGALLEALGDRRGIERYGFALPMDDCDAMVLMDLGGRIDFGWDVAFTREYIGDTPTEMYRHFFQSLACAMGCNLHVRARGENNHHKAEAVFKAFARALKSAVRLDPLQDEVPSSKGIL